MLQELGKCSSRRCGFHGPSGTRPTKLYPNLSNVTIFLCIIHTASLLIVTYNPIIRSFRKKHSHIFRKTSFICPPDASVCRIKQYYKKQVDVYQKTISEFKRLTLADILNFLPNSLVPKGLVDLRVWCLTTKLEVTYSSFPAAT